MVIRLKGLMSRIRPWRKQLGYLGIGNRRGMNGGQSWEQYIAALLSGAPVQIPLTHTAVPASAATGTTATFTRATTKTWQNNDGYLVTGLAGEIGFPGARRIYNLLTAPQAMHAAPWAAVVTGIATVTPTSGQADPWGGTTATKLVFSASNSGDVSVWRQAKSVVQGNMHMSQLYIRADAPVTMYLRKGASTATGSLSVTTEWEPLNVTAAAAASTTCNFDLTPKSDFITGTAGATVYVVGAQLVDITAETDQTTIREYVSVGVASAPYYHGSFVDGVKCFPTDLSGNPITTTTTYDAVTLNGVAGTYVSTPDSVANSITGDIDIRVNAAITTPTTTSQWFVSKIATNGQSAYDFGIQLADTLAFRYTATGLFAGIATATCSTTTGVTAGATSWYRVTYTSATGKVNFYTSSDGSTWSPRGTEQTITAGAIFNGTDALTIATSTGTTSGKVYEAQIYNGIRESGGTLAVDFDASRYAGGTTLTGSTGETWTLQGSAVIHPTNSPMERYKPELAATNLTVSTHIAAGCLPYPTAADVAITTSAVNSRWPGKPWIRIEEKATTAIHVGYWGSVVITANTTNTVSVDVLADSVTKCRISFNSASVTNGCYVDVNLSTGTIYGTGTYGTGTYTSSTITPLTLGGYRVSVTGKLGAADTSNYLSVQCLDAAGATSYLGTVGRGMYAIAAQTETSAFATSPIENTSAVAAATRDKDQLTYSGGDVPNLKTLCATFKRESGVASTGIVLELDDGGGLAYNAMYLTSATNLRFEGRTTGGGGAIQWQVNASNAYTPGSSSKSAVSAATNDIKMAFSGVAQTAGTSATLSPFTQLSVGYFGGTGGLQLSGNVGGIYGWTRNLSQSELNAITAL